MESLWAKVNSEMLPSLFWIRLMLCVSFMEIIIYEFNFNVIYGLLTFFPSNSWVPWANTLSTLEGSVNVINPNPLE